MVWARMRKAVVLFVCGVVCSLCLAAASDTPGATVEVREGDLWTKVKVVRKEGRKTLIHYDDGSEEWVTADRLRDPGTAGATDNTTKANQSAADAAAAASAAASGGSSPAGANKPLLTINSHLQYKHAFWHPGTIVRTQRGWYLIKDDNGRESYWCEPWALRAIGSTYDIEGWGAKGEAVRTGEAAPMAPPGPSPKLTGGALQGGDAIAGAAAAAAPLKINFDNAADPQPGNNVPLSFAPTTRPTVEFASATLRPKSNHLDRAVACRDTPNMIVIGFGGIFQQPTEVMRFDSVTRHQIDVRPLGANDHHIVGAANMGKVILTTQGDFLPKTLCLWELEQGGYKLKASFNPVTDNMRHIAQAALIDATHAMFRDNAGDVYLIDLAERKATAFVKSAAGCEPFLHPNGQVLGVLTTGRTALLLRTSDFTTIAEFPDAAAKGNVAVDPTGECAAYPTVAGPVRVVKIADGSTVGTVAMGGSFGGHIDMPSPNVVLADRKTAYEAKTGIPIWIYSAPPDNRTCLTTAGQVVYCVVADNIVAACVATIPDAAARNALKSVTKDSFILTPGTAVSVSGNFAAFGDEAGKVAEVVRNAITAAGLEFSDKPQAFQVSVNISSGAAERRDYVAGRGPRMGPMGIPFGGEVSTVTVPTTVVTVLMTHEEKAVWSQEFHYQAGESLSMKSGESTQDAVNAAGKPTAAGMAGLAIPGYLPKGSVPGAPAALGASDLTARGFVPAAKVQPQQPQPGMRKQPAPPPQMPGRTGLST